MYRRFFGLNEQPFSPHADPRFFFSSKQHASAKTMLEYAAYRRGAVSIITGDAGCGKSMLIRAFLADLPDEFTVGVVSNPVLLEESLIHGVTQAFHREISDGQTSQLYVDLDNFLRNQYEAGKSAVLIVDEAQHLSPATLEHLRLLTNPGTDSKGALQLVLVGHPHLRRTLSRPDLNQLNQRVLVSQHLGPLDRGDVLSYVDHLLRSAGAERRVFSDAALDAVCRASCGIPRMINTICDMGMLHGYAEDLPVLDETVIEQVVEYSGLGANAQTAFPVDPPAKVKMGEHDSGPHWRQDNQSEIEHHVFGMRSGKE